MVVQELQGECRLLVVEEASLDREAADLDERELDRADGTRWRSRSGPVQVAVGLRAGAAGERRESADGNCRSADTGADQQVPS